MTAIGMRTEDTINASILAFLFVRKVYYVVQAQPTQIYNIKMKLDN